MKKSTLLIIFLQILQLNSFAFAYSDTLEVSRLKLTYSGDNAEKPSLSNCPLHKGAFLVHTATGLSLGSNKYTGFVNNIMTSESKVSSFNIDVDGGWFLSRGIVLGGYFGVASSTNKISDYYKLKSFLVKLGPYARIYIPLNGKIQPFADFKTVLGTGLRNEKYENPVNNTSKGLGFFGIGFGLGTSIFLSDRFALDFKLAFDIESNATADEFSSSATVKQFVGVKTGFNFLLN